jgi:hypothetical protein
VTGAEAVALLAGRLGQRTGLDTLILAELNAAQELKLEKAAFFPWFLFKDEQTLVTVPNQEYVALPVDFLGFDEEVGGLYYDDASGASDLWSPVAKDLYADFKERYREISVSSGESAPAVFDIIGTRLYLRPIPTAQQTLRLLYAQKQLPIENAATTNLWLTHAHDWLLGEAGMMLAAFQTQNPELGSLFATMATAGKQRCSHETTARREAGRQAAMGED